MSHHKMETTISAEEDNVHDGKEIKSKSKELMKMEIENIEAEDDDTKEKPAVE